MRFPLWLPALVTLIAQPIPAQTDSASFVHPDVSESEDSFRFVDLDGPRAIFGSNAEAWTAEQQEGGAWSIAAPLALPNGVADDAFFRFPTAVSGGLAVLRGPSHQPPGSSIKQSAMSVHERNPSGQWLLDAQLFLPSNALAS